MLKKMIVAGLAFGLILPVNAVLAETLQERTAVQEREQMRTETQTRDDNGNAKELQKQWGTSADAAGEQLRNRDRTRDRDMDQLHDRDRDRLHDHQGSGLQSRGKR